MDPLSALSLAASVIGVLDFSHTLFKEYREVRGGSSIGQRELDAAAVKLVQFSERLQKGLRNAEERRPLSENEQTIDDIAAGCQQLAQEIIDTISNLQAKDKASRWNSFAHAFKSLKKKSDIDKLKERIAAYRSQMTLELLAYFDDKQRIQNQDIMNATAASRSDITSMIKVENIQFREQLDRILSGIGDLKQSESFPKEPLQMDTEANVGQHIEVSKPMSTQNGILIMASRSTSDTQQTTRIAVDKVLRCLHFRQISDRYESVKERHEDTFDWILSCNNGPIGPPAGFSWKTSHQPADLPAWLKHGSGCYWINGKPGSGKSTLMKFIVSDKRTAEHLKVWGGGRPLLQASYFCWNLGSAGQKSHAGLLRTLLYQVFKERPELVSEVMTDLYISAAKSGNDDLGEPTDSELERGFHRLLHFTSTTFRIFFAIDGTDELDGDFSKTIQFILSCSSSPNVKFLLSSRPITPCTAAFSNSPNLRLQDLTYHDISRYIRDRLRARREFTKNLPLKDLEYLIHTVTNRSSGVFLWTVFAVNSLVDGIQDGDPLEDIEKRLEELPVDLSGLYEHMLQQIPARHREQVANMFILILHSDLGDDIPEDAEFTWHELRQHFSFGLIPVLQLYHLQRSWPETRSLSIYPLSHHEKESRILEMERQIQSRCGGLVEVHRRATSRSVPSESIPCAEIIHRTVAEFIINSAFLRHSTLNPSEAYFRSFVGYLKNESSSVLLRKNMHFWPELHYFGQRCLLTSLRCAQQLEMTGQPLSVQYLDELDAVVSRHWDQHEQGFRRDRLEKDKRSGGLSTNEHWSIVFHVWDRSAALPTYLYSKSRESQSVGHFLGLLGIAVPFRLPSYVRQCLLNPKRTGPQLTPDGLTIPTALLQIWALGLKSDKVGRMRDGTRSSAELCGALLIAGADPTVRYPGRTKTLAKDTAWSYFARNATYELARIAYLDDPTHTSHSSMKKRYEIIINFVLEILALDNDSEQKPCDPGSLPGSAAPQSLIFEFLKILRDPEVLYKSRMVYPNAQVKLERATRAISDLLRRMIEEN